MAFLSEVYDTVLLILAKGLLSHEGAKKQLIERGYIHGLLDEEEKAGGSQC